MTLTKRTLNLALVFTIWNAAFTHAQGNPAQSTPTSSNSNSSKKQLVVLSTSVDRASQTMTIHGMWFGSRTPDVWCETHPMTVLNSNDTDIVVFLPEATEDGSYLLTVARDNAQNEIGVGQFWTTVGTVKEGPRGATGPKGDAGPAGAKGAT